MVHCTRELEIRHSTKEEDSFIDKFLDESWGSPVISRGQVHYLPKLPCIVAISESKILGCLKYCANPSFVEVVSIDAFVKGQGIGTALMQHVFSLGKRVCLVTTNDNLLAQNFYQKLGMKLVQIHQGAINQARIIKPSIPLHGSNGIPINDELEYEWVPTPAT